MKAQHTPGPWEGCSPFVVMLDGGIPRAICKVGGQEEDPINYRCHSASLENRANVRLIAAAPELLQACQRALHWIRPTTDPDAEFIRGAIAKATGKE